MLIVGCTCLWNFWLFKKRTQLTGIKIGTTTHVGDCALRLQRWSLPRTVRATIGDRTFPAAAASVWNRGLARNLIWVGT